MVGSRTVRTFVVLVVFVQMLEILVPVRMTVPLTEEQCDAERHGP